jgi:hypothetical protein
MKKFLVLTLLFSMSVLGFSQDLELWVDADIGKMGASGTQADPLLNIKEAISKVSNGQSAILHLKGIFHDSNIISISHRYFGADKLIIDGHNETIIYGLKGEPEIPFNPASPHVWEYNCIGIGSSKNIEIRNLEAWGNTELNCSQKSPDKWLENITFRNTVHKYGTGRTIFLGCYTAAHLYFIDVECRETIYHLPSCSHDIYLSGGHWEGSIGLPPVTDCKFIRVKACYAGGRHGIQCNGRFKGILVDGCKLWHNEFAGLSLIGCQDVEVKNCEIWGNNRQGIVCYTYFDDHYFDLTAAGLKIWMACHHSMKNFDIHHNSIMIGPKQWLTYPAHNNKPDGKSAVLINDNMAELLAWEHGLWDWATDNMNIHDNVLISPWPNLIGCDGLCEAMSLEAHGNWVWTYAPDKEPVLTVPYEQVNYPFSQLDQEYPELYSGHIIQDPKIKVYPEYDFVDLGVTPHYDFSKHPSKGNLFSGPAAMAGKGKKYSMIWAFGKGFKEAERKYERTQIPVDKIDPPRSGGLNLDLDNGGTDG